MKIARDLFMLSFYLCGMNAVDLYKADKIEKGRINYNRSKTEGRRKNKAFISIKVPTESSPLIEKYFLASSVQFIPLVLVLEGQ
jgi:hypothetical protein